MKLKLKFQAAFTVAVGAMALTQLQAQSVSNSVPTPPMPQIPSYRQVKPGMTLHELSPVVYFRSILGMTPAERTNTLASKSADYKKAVLEKVVEYEALPPDIREARLHETQLRWDLITLMNLAPEARAPFLKDLATRDHTVLADRLSQWDQLSPELQKAFLEKESFLDFYLRWAASTPAEQQTSLSHLPPERRAELTNELARWQSVPLAERQRLSDEFHQFFAQNEEQQNQALTIFTETERQAMQSALLRFAGMTPAQRQACVDSFQKFATMTPEERNQFLKNADRWEAMTSAERSTWAALVQKYPIFPPMPSMPSSPGQPLMPPFPPGMPIPAPPLPTLPPTNAVVNGKVGAERS
jgi:Protein of unknown function (DUF3106)